MKKRKIVLISGISTSGKTTASYNLIKKLPGWVFVDIWSIKNLFEPLGLKDRTDIGSISKKAVILIVREVMKKMQRNILLDDIKTEFIVRRLRKDLKKYNYELYIINLKVPFKYAIKRDIERAKPTIGIGKNWTEERWNEKMKKLQKGNIVIDTSKNNPEKVVDIILKAINEKPKKHPYINKIIKYQ
jgi:tRNA uridine 5-carbamoylmethylation protein Kti12